MEVLTSLRYFLRLIRWRNILMINITQLLVFIFLDFRYCSNYYLTTNLFLVIISTGLVAAAGYIINDYFDVKIDAINKPKNLIISKHIQPKYAIIIHTIFSLIAVILGTIVNYKLGIINLIITTLLWIYSSKLKYLLMIGNIVIASLLSLSILVVYYASNHLYMQWIVVYAGFAFLYGLVREIIKDIEDMKGDAQYNANTLPIAFGVVTTKKIVLVLMSLILLLLIMVAVYFIITQKNSYLTIYLFSVLILPSLFVINQINKAENTKDYSQISSILKLITLGGIISMALRLDC
jgi:4-hydroxybenzoate polyprenyltransferase